MKLTFTKARKELDSLPFINQGGCGLAALALYDTAVREGKKPKIVYCYSFWGDSTAMHKNNLFKEGKRKRAYACSHVLIKVGKRYWDSTGEIKSKDVKWAYELDEDITRKHLIASINNKGAWNDCFDRRRCMPIIKKMLKRGTQVAV